MDTASRLPHVVILGGGFGGLWAARGLARAPVQVTLIDRCNHHLFQPLLYQVATAALSGPDIAAPLRHIVRHQANATVWMDEVIHIDPGSRRVAVRERSIEYDYLIVATGSTDAYFGHDAWSRYAPGLKTMNDALAIRRRILTAFESAEREADADRRALWLSFVIVGAGPTGVELAGTLAEIAQHTLPREFRRARPRTARIHLVEAGPRVLSAMPESLSVIAQHKLERMGVHVHANSAVTGVDASGTYLLLDRLSQPPRRDGKLGLVVPVLAAQCENHRGREPERQRRRVGACRPAQIKFDER